MDVHGASVEVPGVYGHEATVRGAGGAGLVGLIAGHLKDKNWQVQDTVLSMMERFRTRESIPTS